MKPLINELMTPPWLESQEERNKRTVTDFYKAIISNDKDTMQSILAPNLEWWFHGPPCHRHHLISLLTGSSARPLVPNLIVGFGPVTIAEGYDEKNLVWWVHAEGYDEKNLVWWVHAWTVTEDGTITEVREYVNTWVTVTRLGNLHGSDEVAAAATCQSVWQSKLCDESVPGLILAI